MRYLTQPSIPSASWLESVPDSLHAGSLVTRVPQLLAYSRPQSDLYHLENVRRHVVMNNLSFSPSINQFLPGRSCYLGTVITKFWKLLLSFSELHIPHRNRFCLSVHHWHSGNLSFQVFLIRKEIFSLQIFYMIYWNSKLFQLALCFLSCMTFSSCSCTMNSAHTKAVVHAILLLL